MARADWVLERSREIASLCDRRVDSWVGVEFALREESVVDGQPQFSDPQVPCLQLLGLQAFLGNGDATSFGIYQDNALFGLLAFPEAKFSDEDWDGIYRWRRLTELPIGQVDQVEVFADEGVLAEAHLRIGGKPLLLVAGELEETATGALVYRRLDESVLAFTDAAALEHAPWTSSRRGLVLVHC